MAIKPDEMLSDVDVNFISYVGQAANKQKFQVFKSATEPPAATPTATPADQQMTGFFSGLKELVMKFAGGTNGQGKVPVVKASFAGAWQARQVKDDYWDLWYTLDDVLWGIIFRQPGPDEILLTSEQKAVMAAESIDQFKSILVGLISSTAVTKSEVIKSAEKVHRYFIQKADELIKAEDDMEFPAGAYAYAPDSKDASTWKLRLWETPYTKATTKQVNAVVTALAKANIPEDDLPGVLKKVKDAWVKVNPDAADDEMPEVLKNAVTKASGSNKRFTAKRIEALTSAHSILGEILADAVVVTEGEVGEGEEEEVKAVEVQKMMEAAIQKAMEPINQKLTELEKGENPITDPEAEMTPEIITKSIEGAIEKAMESIDERLMAIEKARGISQGGELVEPVQKSVNSGFGGAFL